MPETIQNNYKKQLMRGIGITGLWTALAIHIPILGFFFSLLIPVTVFYYRALFGRNHGAAAPVAVFFLVWMYIGSLNLEVLFIAQLLALGFIIGEVVERNPSVEQTFLYSGLTAFFTGVGCLIFYSNVTHQQISVMINDYLAKSLQMTLLMYENMGISEETVSVMSNSLDKIRYVLIRILPALSGSFILFLIWITLLMARPVFKTKNLFFPDFGALNLWKAPEYLVWGVITTGVLLILPIQSLKLVGLNGMIILMTIYFFGGIAIVSYFFEKKNFPLAIRIFLYSLIALQQIFLLIIIGLGFFDIWLNFRKVNSEK